MHFARPALRLAVFGVTSLFCLGIAELGLRILGYEPIYNIYSKPSILWQTDPLLGWSHTPSSEAEYVGPRPFPIEFENTVRINSYGLRGPEISPIPEGGKRVLFMGDSLVAGFEVPDDRTFAALAGPRLSRSLGQPVQSFNAGVRGYGTDQSLLWFRERGKQLKADWVVFVHGGNDIRNNMTLHRPRRPFGKPAFSLHPDGTLEVLGQPVSEYPICAHVALDDLYQAGRRDGFIGRALCHAELSLSDHSALFTWAAFQLRRSAGIVHTLRELIAATTPVFSVGVAHADDLTAGSVDLEATAADYRLTSALLVEMAREVRESGGRLWLVIRDTELAQMDRAALEAEGAIPETLSIPKSMHLGRPLKFINDGHYNQLGHSLAARVVTDRLAELMRSGD